MFKFLICIELYRKTGDINRNARFQARRTQSNILSTAKIPHTWRFINTCRVLVVVETKWRLQMNSSELTEARDRPKFVDWCLIWISSLWRRASILSSSKPFLWTRRSDSVWSYILLDSFMFLPISSFTNILCSFKYSSANVNDRQWTEMTRHVKLL